MKNKKFWHRGDTRHKTRKDNVSHFIARHLPSRVLMWACITAIARFTEKNPKSIVPKIKAMDVVGFFEL
jgi:hypothetical protein